MNYKKGEKLKNFEAVIRALLEDGVVYEGPKPHIDIIDPYLIRLVCGKALRQSGTESTISLLIDYDYYRAIKEKGLTVEEKLRKMFTPTTWCKDNEGYSFHVYESDYNEPYPASFGEDFYKSQFSFRCDKFDWATIEEHWEKWGKDYD